MAKSRSYEEFLDLTGTGVGIKKQLAPEEEPFHAIYICGEERQNHKDITELVDKLQIRGVDYNKNEVFLIITHVIKPNVNRIFDKVKRSWEFVCSSRKDSTPWVGSSGRKCVTAKEKVPGHYCTECRQWIILFGILCENKSGKIWVGPDGKPEYAFISNHGMSWEPINSYLIEVASEEIDPIFEPVTPESEKWEKENFDNSKRVVTVITTGKRKSNFSTHTDFSYEKGSAIPKGQLIKLAEIAKSIKSGIAEKLDRIIGYRDPQEADYFDNDGVKNEQRQSKAESFGEIPPATEQKSEPKNERKQQESKTPPKSEPFEDAFNLDDIAF